jgi:kumamolisin
MAMNSFESVLLDAAGLGITVLAAAGDSGSSDGEADGRAHADFPASAPHMLACGGTRLVSTDGTTIIDEVVWNDASGATGGGVSDFFPIPDWQTSAGVPLSVNPEHFRGRGVPDLAGNADRETGYAIRSEGTNVIVGGTSAVAPLVSALIAQINQFLGCTTVGFMSPTLYTDSFVNQAFADVTTGNNNAYNATTGWDACTGWGHPDGRALMNAIGVWLFARFEPSLFD